MMWVVLTKVGTLSPPLSSASGSLLLKRKYELIKGLGLSWVHTLNIIENKVFMTGLTMMLTVGFRRLLSLSIASALFWTPGFAIAQWLDPEPESRDYVDMVTFLDHLKTCQPVASALGFPLFQGIFVESVVQGWRRDRAYPERPAYCFVEMNAFAAEKPELRSVYGVCRYRPSTLALLTDERADEQARTGEIIFSTNDPRDRALSEAMEQDCELNESWLVELIRDLEQNPWN